jgi:hypothetical protein
VPAAIPARRDQGGNVIAGPAWLGEFQEVQMPVPAPVDDVVTTICLDSLFHPFASHAVGEEVGHDAALRVDFLFEEPQQFTPLHPRRQWARATRLGEDEEHAQAIVLAEFKWLRGRRRHVVDDADEQVPLAERGPVRRRTCDLSRHAGERGGKVIFLLRRTGQLNAERALGLGVPELAENLLT